MDAEDETAYDLEVTPPPRYPQPAATVPTLGNRLPAGTYGTACTSVKPAGSPAVIVGGLRARTLSRHGRERTRR